MSKSLSAIAKELRMIGVPFANDAADRVEAVEKAWREWSELAGMPLPIPSEEIPSYNEAIDAALKAIDVAVFGPQP